VTAGYTPGWGEDAVVFLERRSAAHHAAAFLAHLRPGMRVLDAGCGPGTITAGLAGAVAPGGAVVAVDRSEDQVERANARFASRGLGHVRACVADAGDLPFADGSFDAALCHAVLEHVADPPAVLAEIGRVVGGGGPVMAASPDWDGFVVAPSDPLVDAALAFYRRIQEANGGDVRAGRRLGQHMRAAGLHGVRMWAEYECHADRRPIAEYLAARIERAPDEDDAVARGWASAGDIRGWAEALRRWCAEPAGLFAQAWIWAGGRAA